VIPYHDHDTRHELLGLANRTQYDVKPPEIFVPVTAAGFAAAHQRWIEGKAPTDDPRWRDEGRLSVWPILRAKEKK
jgi:hypothetical protein